MKRLLLPVVLAALTAVPSGAMAWGGEGHRIVGQAAARVLPAEVPAFLRTRQAALDIGELAREPDRAKGFGKIHDHNREGGHFVDLDENGLLLGGPPITNMPPTRQDYEKLLRTYNQDSWQVGYLQYEIVDRWQRLSKDFAYWRVLKAAEANPKWRKNRKWFAADRRRREALILEHLGELGHYVGDGAQPMHVSSHYNGWGDGPNPKGYSTARLHAPFEGRFVRVNVKGPAVEVRMAPLRTCDCAVEKRVLDYIVASNRYVEPFYQLEKEGAFKDRDARMIAFATERLAAAASELRDMTVDAWRASAATTVGWRPIGVADVLSGRIDPYAALYGVD